MRPHADIPPQPVYPGYVRDTRKACAPDSESTYFDDDMLYRSGISTHYRQSQPRYQRQYTADSHSRMHINPPPKLPSHRNHCPQQPPAAIARHSERFLPNQDPNSEHFVGSLSKKQFIQRTSRALDEQANRNAGVELPTYSEPESVFFSVSRPDIPTEDYIKRLVTYTQCSNPAFVVMLVYLDRIAKANRRLHVTPYNMHRLLVTALTLACKVLDDRCFSNVHYAKVGGIPTAREMNRLELQFLSYLKYHLHVTPETYEEKLGYLQDLRSPPPALEYAALTSPVTASSSMDKEELASTMSYITSSTTSSSMSFTEVPSNARTRPELNHLIHSESYPRAAQHSATVEKSTSWNSGRTHRVDKRTRYNGRRHRADFAA
eukprot:GFKZ01011353.1.p1 GENE.GFKZ01011353.1~~GFKZ01011353.1.p1  ORF type:complete len:376 (+),score=13.42 GFKZ01011353.1:281-1408(+)